MGFGFPLDCNAGAAFGTAALEDEAAGTRGHARDKPVDPLTAALLRLVRSLRHNERHFTLSGSVSQTDSYPEFGA